MDEEQSFYFARLFECDSCHEVFSQDNLEWYGPSRLLCQKCIKAEKTI